MPQKRSKIVKKIVNLCAWSLWKFTEELLIICFQNHHNIYEIMWAKNLLSIFLFLTGFMLGSLSKEKSYSEIKVCQLTYLSTYLLLMLKFLMKVFMLRFFKWLHFQNLLPRSYFLVLDLLKFIWAVMILEEWEFKCCKHSGKFDL